MTDATRARRTSGGALSGLADGVRRSAAALGAPLTAAERRTLAVKNAHAGETVFVLGAGPSVAAADLEALDGAVAIAVNRFHLAYPRVRMRPRYTVASNAATLKAYGAEIARRAETPLFAPIGAGVAGERIASFVVAAGESVFQPDPFKGVGDAGGSVHVAMQLAAWMGAARIVLYGVDHTYAVSEHAEEDGPLRRSVGERNHFVAEYRPAGVWWRPPDLDRRMAAFAAARAWGDAHGVAMVNATRGGGLDVFARVDLLAEAAAARGAVQVVVSV